MADLSDSIALIIDQKLKFMIVIIRIPLQKKKKKKAHCSPKKTPPIRYKFSHFRFMANQCLKYELSQFEEQVYKCLRASPLGM